MRWITDAKNQKPEKTEKGKMIEMILAGRKKKEFNFKKSYETERLLLKPTDLEDGEFILQLLNSESFIKYIGDRNVRTIELAENYISIDVFLNTKTRLRKFYRNSKGRFF